VGDQSIWKKEISFGRKRKEPAADAPEENAASSEQPTSVWKKEISFGRKKKTKAEDTPAEAVAAEAEAAVAVPDPQPGPEETVPDEQMWTRAVSFGRKRADDPVPGSDPEPGPEAAAPEESWSKEVSFSRKPEAELLAEAPAPVEAVADVPEPVAPGSDPEPGPEAAAPEETSWSKEVSFSRKSDPDAPAPVEAVADAPEPVASGSNPEPGPEAAAPEETSWSKEVSFSRKQAEPVAEPPAPVAAVPQPPVAPAVAPVPAAPPVAEAATEVIPAAEPEAEAKVPFWKKDISFGGGKKREKKPKAEKAPKAQKEPKAAKEKTPKEPKQPKQKQPKVKAPRGARGAKKLVGLKVGASQVAAARVANNGAAELLQVAREPIEPGIVVGGELRDPDALGEALKEFFAKHKLPKKGVRLGIANNRIGVRTFEIAGISDQKQLTNAIRFRAQEALPIPIDEAVLDYKVLSESVDEEGQPTKRILLVVAYRELIDRYMDACKKAGIGLVGIDLEAFALLRALQAPQDGVGGDAGAALVAVAIGHDRSTFAVSDGRICEFTRVLEWGGAALNVAIARALDAAPSEVEDVKRALALTDEMVPEGLTPEQAKNARDAMRRAIQTFARELVSSLQYYQNQPGSLGIGEIVLTGGTAHLAGLAGELERLIGVRVRVGDPLARMKVSKKLGEMEQLGSLAVAIGLGIED
jgi:type IV pilus assembly protein PilM